MDRPYMFSCSAILLALCFDEIAHGVGAFSVMVPGMYSSLTGDLKRTSWPGGGVLVELKLHVPY